jgi:hypothetical protein
MPNNLYHLEDIHGVPRVQQDLAVKILEMYEQRRIGAVFCENISKTDYPVSLESVLDYTRFLRFLRGAGIPVYGAEDPELHQEHFRIMQQMYYIHKKTLTSGLTTEKIDRIIKNSSSYTSKELDRIISMLDRINSTMQSLLQENQKYTALRSYYMVDHAVKMALEQGYADIALVSGGEHGKTIEERTKEHGFKYINMPAKYGKIPPEYSMQAARKLFDKTYNSGNDLNNLNNTNNPNNSKNLKNMDRY